LLPECYGAHTYDEVQRHATNLTIRLALIPPGATIHIRPLDKPVFGILKGSAPGRFCRNVIFGEEDLLTMGGAVENFVEAWGRFLKMMHHTSGNILAGSTRVVLICIEF
jgi:hypothetical protein